jgi:hypothetical protein
VQRLVILTLHRTQGRDHGSTARVSTTVTSQHVERAAFEIQRPNGCDETGSTSRDAA